MVNVRKEATKWLNNHYLDHVNVEFKRIFGGTKLETLKPKEIMDYYKYSQHHLWTNSGHDVPAIMESWKDLYCLDFGGGAGNVSFRLAKQGCIIDFYDINYMQQDFVRDMARKHGLPIRVLPFVTGTAYDAIILRDVVEHLPDYESVLDGLICRLKWQGMFYVKPEFADTTPSPLHYKDKTKSGFKEFMERQGFFKQGRTNIWKRMQEL